MAPGLIPGRRDPDAANTDRTGQRAGVFTDPEEMPVFSYAASGDRLAKRLAIRAIEKVTGQPKLKRMYLDNRMNPVPDESFWRAAVRRLELTLNYDHGRLMALPKTGPLVIVANHPFGVLDGIVISYLTSLVRDDFLVLTNSVLYQAPEVRPYLLPIDFAETPEALKTNLDSRRRALDLLNRGGCVVVFPGGTVSTAKRPFGRALDPDWKPFTAKLILAAKAPVAPIYFCGQNSRLFQIFSNVSQTLRLSLLFKEVANKIGRQMDIKIGPLIDPSELTALPSRQAVMDYLRDRTYALAPVGRYRSRLKRVSKRARQARLEAADLDRDPVNRVQPPP